MIGIIHPPQKILPYIQSGGELFRPLRYIYLNFINREYLLNTIVHSKTANGSLQQLLFI